MGGDGFKGGKHDPTMSRRRGNVQRDDGYEIVVKVRNIVYDEKPLQQTVSKEITIWATHEGRDNSVGASKLFQQGHQ